MSVNQLLTPDDCQVDNVYTLVNLEGNNKKYNSHLAAVKGLVGSAVTVDVYNNATITVRSENLNKIPSSVDRPKLLQTLKRIGRLHEKAESFEPAVTNFLKGISKQINVSPLEEDILFCIEQHCGVFESESKL
ncbi:MAG: hypothetical protein CLLPBCKN_006341 [Chroococcidiopsis cubana SAG 39.79]|uniref:hypothetical protein n=1 Tax=Chroococcidiopsis cubana TaxID=171392 RepID=UPI000F8D7346|nr:hypothetical protein [Chroococcidiopsis cubana]MDZ4876906.1 hypothetical protein [Chroococcidiopsis cubana SAG 39.79]